jgi:hypothetical protein
MKQENIGKTIIIIVIVGVILAALGLGINYYFEFKRKEEIKTRSTEFIKVWGNFNDESDPKYLESLKPYLDQQNYTDMSESINELNSMTTDKGYEPTQSQFTITSGPNIKKQEKSYITTTEGQRYYVGVERLKQKVELTWVINNGVYLISEINAIKQ